MTALFLIWIALPLALWIYIAALDSIRFPLIGALGMLLAATWCCDSGAYFIGRLLGKHRLYPLASPNKTVEGAIGGLLFAALPLTIVKAAGWGAPQILDIVILTVAVGGFGQAGDLLESLFKREAGVKDSSHIIPGHGGLLDRFDSLLLSTPVFAAYLLISA
jgi:phosphatidate cytidylyltransferase